jgi:hypothetical protein
MKKRASFHELAEFELNDAAAFFESKTAGLGVRFVSAVEKAVAEIEQHPQASPIIHQRIRRKLVRRFPYSIMFTIKPDHLRILAIANQKRRPFYWRGRE